MWMAPAGPWPEPQVDLEIASRTWATPSSLLLAALFNGSLQGDMIVDAPTDNAPYGYWIEVFSQHRSGRYERILKYRSHTGYCDGNPLPVADSEMPEIMERLGVWKLGDPLPIPMHEPSDCGRLVMRHGEEWCRNLCLRYRRSNCSGEVRNTLRVPASPRIATMAVERIAAMSN